MALWTKIEAFAAHIDPMNFWLASFVITGLLVGIVSGYFKARKVQPNTFRWKTFRNEIMFAALNLAVDSQRKLRTAVDAADALESLVLDARVPPPEDILIERMGAHSREPP